ncbi:MAG: SCO1664 family protein [Chloroflexi bacterium]|nr:MAG: SCO1664 family protein [Chloroflexota bacterium]MBL1196606.1 SCO1664 family protein [Chloroflexota bacterium]NOH13901.1 SCO1664 family protein [Chloroflexota bacterium]
MSKSPSTEDVLNSLQTGDFDVEGQFMWGSNYTFLVNIQHGDGLLKGVYKPTRGERPLWDFPSDSLAGREVAAYLLSEELGWGLVPPTVYRAEGPAGGGSLQLHVEHDPEYHYFNFSEEHRQRLRIVVLFDILVNNADRKGGHVLVDPHDHIWLIDHGICFHSQYKLRTVIWDFVGEPLPEEACKDIAALLPKLKEDNEFCKRLEAHLMDYEIRAMVARAERLLEEGVFPAPRNDERAYPWPAV